MRKLQIGQKEEEGGEKDAGFTEAFHP